MEPYSMKISLLSWDKKHLAVVFHLLVIIGLAGALGSAQASTNPPVLISDVVSTRAIAFESVTMRPEPFNLNASTTFSPDNRTRVAIFAMNLDLLAGETANGNPTSFTADA